MLLGGNLVSLFVALVVAVGWLVARWKWRCAVARRKEIRRLMALAAAEATRVEIEDNAGYISYGSILGSEPVVEEPVIGSGSGSGSYPASTVQSRCEVCFSPTTTRCKQCKAVHYCSGKCQINHWRQGHKDECISWIARPKIDPGVHPHLKDLNEEVTGNVRNDTRIKGLDSNEPIELPSKENLFRDSACQVFNGNNATGSKTSHDTRRRDNVNAPDDTLPGVCSESTTSILLAVDAINKLKEFNGIRGQRASMDLDSMEPLLSERPSPMKKPGHCTSANAPDEKSELSTSSSYSIADSEDHSLSEPSKRSYGFWGETVESVNSNTKVIAEVSKFNMTSSRSSHLSANRVDTDAKILVSDVKRLIAGGPSPYTLMPKESTDVAGLLEVSRDGFKSGELFSSSTLSSGNSLTSSSSSSSLEEESKASSSYLLGNMCEGQLPRKHIGGSNLLRLSHKQLDHEIGRKNVIFDTMKWQGNDSLRLRSSEAYSSASNYGRKPSSVDVKYVKTERARENAVSFLDKGGRLETAVGGADILPRRVMDKNGTSNVIGMASAGTGAGNIKRYEGSFSYEHFVKLYNWNEVELCPCGLINCGNSCYANAVIQCLAFTPPLTAYFLQGLHTRDCQRKEWCFSCEFEILVRKAKASKYPLSPARIMCEIDRVGSHLVHGREEDAHEFLRYAIDAMQLGCLKEAGTKVPRSMDEETTLLGLTFGGFLRSKIECLRCGGKSEQHERMMDLTVEIEGDIAALEDALRRFTHSEILDGENKYHCGRCKSYEKAKKKLRVLEAPNVLTIVLKKFQAGKYGKLNKRVQFHEILNIAPYMSGTSDTSPVYQLYGVVVHVDLLSATFSGHYVCYVKNSQGRWFEANDSMVEEVGLEKVLSRDAYILFYSRCSPRAPRLIRSSVVPHDPRKATSLVDKFKSHPRDPWYVSAGGVIGSMANGYFHPSYTSRHPALSNLEEESLSDYSSSFFSDGGSYGTETSNEESTSTSEYFEQILGDMGNSLE